MGGVAGGQIGALTGSGVSEEDAHFYAEGYRRGGTLVTARVPDEKVTEADETLSGAVRIDVAERRRRYTADGWQGFKHDLDPYGGTD